MNGFLSKVIGPKKEWRAMEARAAALPSDYRIVYGEMKSYMWRVGGGMDTMAVLEEVLALFEASAAVGKPALEVTGDNVAAFCDDRVGGPTPYLDKWRASLNRTVAAKLAE
jgi:DNA-binding ferritin-like protein (Dps family)